jgi:arabinogalactan endo-1,4-beta-galactosidase
VPYFESLGVQYKDGGQVQDVFQILRNHGINCVRLRLFTSSQAQAAADPYNYINNTNYTIPLAVRVKNAGLLFSLDFHYSDTWADPGHQATPAAWANDTFPQLVQDMYNYNSNTIAAFAAAGAMPDYVQIGNEITDGMLWPLGRVNPNANGGAQWNQLGQLMKAAVQGIQDAASATGKPMPKIVVHIGSGGDSATSLSYFNNLEAQGVPFDIIGESYYPFFQGSLASLSNCLVNTANTFGKPIIVAETAFPWTNTCQTAWLPDLFGYPPSVIGQVSFLVAEGQVLRSVPNGLMAGVFYWGGEYQAANGVDEAEFNTASFWDAEGNVLPSLNALVSIAAPLTTGPPLATTLGASATTASNATLYAQAYANGLPAAAYIEWGANTNYGNVTATNILAANYLTQNMTATIAGLTPSTTYYFRGVVVNSAGTNCGGDLTFRTASLVSEPPTNLYQEDFGSMAFALDLGEATTLPMVGWNQILPAGGYSGIYIADALDINTGQALPTSTTYFGGNTAGIGFFYTTNGAGNGTLGDSQFTSIDPAPYSNLTFSLETQYSYQGTNVSSSLAVQVGGAWYVSTSPMSAFVESAVSADFSETSQAYNPLASSWKNLTFSRGSVIVGNNATGDLSGPITGIGIVVTLAGAGSWDYGNLLISPTDPFITTQPTNQSVALGSDALFTVAGTGAPTLGYQWLVNGTNSPTATNSSLGVVNVQPSDAGTYQVVLANSYQSVTSSVATLSVTGVPVSFLTSPGSIRLANGQVQLSVAGLTGQGPVEIDVSTNLMQWVPIFTNPSGFGTTVILDTNAGNYPERFYRAVTPAGP